MKRICVIWLSIMLIFGSTFLIIDVSDNTEGKIVVYDGIEYVPHAPIRINSNADFDAAHGVVNGATGDGSSGNPWIIEDWDINGTGYGYCLFIGNTTDYFEVRNCSLHDAIGIFSIPFYRDAGLTLYNAQNGIIASNNVSHNGHCGIYLDSSSGNVITNNTAISNYMYGILCIYSSNNTASFNTVSDNWGGIWFYSSTGNIISDNIANKNKNGIGLWYVFNHTLTNNTMIDCGIKISGQSLEPWNTHNIDTSNSVNGKPVYYWKNRIGGTVPLGAGEVILANCSNILVENQNVSDGTNGIVVGFSWNCTIANNYACSNTGNGIHVSFSNRFAVINNIASNNYGGIGLSYNNNTTIMNNIANSNDQGFGISHSNYITFSNNMANSNQACGFRLTDTDNSTITNSTFAMNLNYGLALYGGGGLYSNRNNLIYHNNFINNSKQSFDDLGANFWDNAYPSGGNYWDDYTGVDFNSTQAQNVPPPDGIGDTPYLFNFTQDTYPLMEQWQTTPLANAGPDQTVPPHTLVTFNGSGSIASYGITNYWWNFTDGIPKTLTGVSPNYIFDNESVILVTLEITDTIGQKDSDTMIVNITDMNPIANAGPDQMVSQHTLVNFDGSASTDDVGITNYWWNFTDGGPQSLMGISPFYTFDNEGVYTVTLTAMDTIGQTNADIMEVNVTDGDAPVAVPGPDQAVAPSTIVVFDGSGSYDPGHLGEPINDGIVNWTWTFDDGTGPVTLWGLNPTHQFDIPGTYLVTLMVKDNAPVITGGPYANNDTMNVKVVDTFDVDISSAALCNDWILMSFPNKEPGHPFTIIVDAFDSGAGFVQWDIVRGWDNVNKIWMTSAKFWPPSLNTFDYVDNTMAFWLHISDYGDGVITIPGDLALQNDQVIIPLKTGWNLVGYPFPTGQEMFNTFGILASRDRPVEVYDPTAPYGYRTADIMIDWHMPGGGYWVHTAFDEDLLMWCP